MNYVACSVSDKEQSLEVIGVKWCINLIRRKSIEISNSSVVDFPLFMF